MTDSWLQFKFLRFSDLTLLPLIEGKIHPLYKNILKVFFCMSGTPGTQELGQEQYLTFYDIYVYLISLIA